MKVLSFDTKQGNYHFELAGIDTELHAHPAMEILYARDSPFVIETPTNKTHQATFVIVDANVHHRIVATSGPVQVIMLERSLPSLEEIWRGLDIGGMKDIWISEESRAEEQLFRYFANAQIQYHIKDGYSSRILNCLDYLNSASVDYPEMMKVLQGRVHLSESRLSHLFKEEVGISIKRYLVWSRLKRTAYTFINEDRTLYEAALEAGFYDQAHMSNAFKQLLGLRPSAVYNSRMIQE